MPFTHERYFIFYYGFLDSIQHTKGYGNKFITINHGFPNLDETKKIIVNEDKDFNEFTSIVITGFSEFKSKKDYNQAQGI